MWRLSIASRKPTAAKRAFQPFCSMALANPTTLLLIALMLTCIEPVISKTKTMSVGFLDDESFSDSTLLLHVVGNSKSCSFAFTFTARLTGTVRTSSPHVRDCNPSLVASPPAFASVLLIAMSPDAEFVLSPPPAAKPLYPPLLHETVAKAAKAKLT